MSSTNTKFTILYLIRNFFSNIKVRNSFLIISILGIIVFSNGLFNDFVGDDNTQILENEVIIIEIYNTVSKIGSNPAGQQNRTVNMYLFLLEP
jgi:hypothetical protein